MIMTKEERDAIRERCEAATEGPWMWDANSHCKEISLHGVHWPMNIVMDFVRYGMGGAAPRFNMDGIMERADKMLKSYPGKEHHIGFDDYIDHPDADFIANARTDIPDLLDMVDELTARAESAERELQEAEIIIESACTLLTPRSDGSCSAESARQILFDYGEPREGERK